MPGLPISVIVKHSVCLLLLHISRVKLLASLLPVF